MISDGTASETSLPTDPTPTLEQGVEREPSDADLDFYGGETDISAGVGIETANGRGSVDQVSNEGGRLVSQDDVQAGSPTNDGKEGIVAEREPGASAIVVEDLQPATPFPDPEIAIQPSSTPLSASGQLRSTGTLSIPQAVPGPTPVRYETRGESKIEQRSQRVGFPHTEDTSDDTSVANSSGSPSMFFRCYILLTLLQKSILNVNLACCPHLTLMAQYSC